ncbi:MAG: hypothetical protein AB8B99_17775 [Phormidesmis sp.]
MYVLDTNTLIYFFKGAGQVAARMGTVSPDEIDRSAARFSALI